MVSNGNTFLGEERCRFWKKKCCTGSDGKQRVVRGPEWMLNEQNWPPQPKLQQTTSVMIEEKAVKEIFALADEKQPDE